MALRRGDGYYVPVRTKIINAIVRDARHGMNELLHLETDLRIDEHYFAELDSHHYAHREKSGV